MTVAQIKQLERNLRRQLRKDAAEYRESLDGIYSQQEITELVRVFKHGFSMAIYAVIGRLYGMPEGE